MAKKDSVKDQPAKREHRMGKFYGYEYEETAEGKRYYLAPALQEQFQKNDDEQRALTEFVNNLNEWLLKQQNRIWTARRSWWDHVREDIPEIPPEGCSYFVGGYVLVPPPAPPADPKEKPERS